MKERLVRLGRPVGAALLAAALLAALDVGATCMFVAAAYSSPWGLLSLLAWTTLIFFLVAAPLAAVWHAGTRTVGSWMPRPDPAALTAAALTVVALVGARSALAELLSRGDIEFPERLALARSVFEVGITAVLLAVGRWVLWPLLLMVFGRAPRLSEPRVVVAGWLLVAIGWLAVAAAWGLAPIHQVKAAALCGLGAVALAVVFWDVVLPPFGRRRAISALLIAGFAVVSGGVGQRSRHARFLLFAHSPMARGVAEVMRDLVDTDGDGASPTWLFGQDCAEGDPVRGPARLELRADGIDQDCQGGDAPPLSGPAAPSSPWSDCQVVSRPSLLLITIDAMRADGLGSRLTPSLWRLAQQGQWFTRAYSPSGLTKVTFASLFTGYPPSSLAENLLRAREFRLPPTLAQRLRSHGYGTAVVNYLQLDAGLLSGFELVNRQQQIDLHPDSVKVHLASAAVTNGAIEYVAGHQERPFFLALHYPDLHAPYLEPPDQRFSAGEVTPYERSLAYTDHHVGRLLSHLSQSGALGRTVVVVTADHGESLGQRGHEGHGVNVFDEVIHVPLLVWVPGCPPRRFDDPVSMVHLAGTLSALAGVPATPTLTADLTQSDRVAVSVAAMTTTGVYLRSVVRGRYKLMVDVRSGGRLLFDLETDPEETVNLYRQRPAVVADLEAAYQRWLDSRPPLVE